MPSRLTHDEFVERLKKSHPNLEVLSIYNGIDNKVTVKCKIHNYEYETTPHRLKQGSNCQLCYNDRRGNTQRKTINEVLEQFRQIHGDKYQYPHIETEFVNTKSPLTIVCPKHGEFKQTHNKHYICQQGCPKCNQSHIERLCETLLRDNNVKYISQHTFEWLKFKNKLYLDFYLPDYNIAIECQGEQHFLYKSAFRKPDDFEFQKQRDIIKYNLCKKHNIKLFYIIPKKYLKISKQECFNGIYDNNILEYEEIIKKSLIKKIFNKIKKTVSD